MFSTLTADQLATLMDAARGSAIEAGLLALDHFRAGRKTSARIWSKHGGSPVTEADVAVDTFLKVRLSVAFDGARWLSEETADDRARLGARHVWVVDPIDGTRAFMAGHLDWAVCIALLEEGEPVLGIVHAPALGVTYAALRGGGSLRNDVATGVSGRTSLAGARIAGPKPMVDLLAEATEIEAVARVPSLALRIARVADGSLDGGLVSPDARDWDLAAADLLLREAGGRLSTLTGGPLAYNRPIPVHGTLVAAGNGLHGGLMAAAQGLQGPRAGKA